MATAVMIIRVGSAGMATMWWGSTSMRLCWRTSFGDWWRHCRQQWW